MVQGTIIKGIAGFYYVESDQIIYECKARGKFRKANMTPLIGDRVMISLKQEENSTDRFLEGTIEEILPRTNSLIRPPVSNVDQAMVVFSVTYPQIHLDLLDRFLIHIEREHIKPYIVLNKIDEDNSESYQYIVDRYIKVGYEVICLSAREKLNTDILMPKLKDKTTVFAGPSGVGKSTLLNTIEESFTLETGEVSEKIKRGKHTTRHVELMPLTGGGFVLDTPGFTSLQLDGIEAEDLKHYFIEFKEYEGTCKFSGCTHTHEPDCNVKAALEAGEISKERYNSYMTYYKQLKDTRRW
ncbi:ribosome small subunit-dependent GTPase A [Cellulosilyticum ruminicola]|uniref:ribosome small subunit-dependent GTPase A n=1 Tax=Cellulosilyticum ruminicola TaxID=425254 RepID=UPI0006D0F018|nr:ribosome small subunit-dependent GTPase A [Cellulosilyticum ruminicola]